MAAALRRRRAVLVLAVVGVVGLHAPRALCAEPALSGAEEAVAAYLAGRDRAARERHAAFLAALAPDVPTLAALVEGAWRWPENAPTGEVVTWERETLDGQAHTVYAYAPEAYETGQPWPALVYLHGDVTRIEDGGGQEGIDLLAAKAEEHGFLLLCPSARNGAHWWTPNGRDLILGALGDLKRRYRVDADRVAAMGRSDGGSACYHLLAHAPDPFSCFVSLVGNPLVTATYGGPTWLSNVTARPVYAVNGGRDRLYPAAQMLRHVEALREAGCQLTWHAEPDAGHDLSFFEERWPEIHAFWMAHPREPPPRHVDWTMSSARGGRRAWLEVTRLAPETSEGDAVPLPLDGELPSVVPQSRLGLRFDAAYDGPGLRIDEVEENAPADAAGFVAGDVLMAVDGTSLGEASALDSLRERIARGSKEQLAFDVRRDGKKHLLLAHPHPTQEGAVPSPAERGYGLRPATVSAEIGRDNHVEIVTSGVGALRLHLLPALVDVDRELIVVLDGREVFRGPVPLDASHVLEQARRDGPGAPASVGCLRLEVADHRVR